MSNSDNRIENSKNNRPLSKAEMDHAMLYQWEGKPKFRYAYPVSLQHLLAMFLSNLTPILVIGHEAQATEAQMLVMIQCAMIVAGLSTLLNLYPIKIGWLQIGARLPIIMGTASTFIAPGVAVASTAVAMGHTNPIGLVIGGLIGASVAELIVGLTYKWIGKFFPPLVIGATLIAIGLMLIPIGINNFAGGVARGVPNPGFGSISNLSVGFTVFFTNLLIQRFGKGILKISSILISVVLGYLMIIVLGHFDILEFRYLFDVGEFANAFREANVVAVPIPWYLRPEFNLSAIGGFIVVYIISGLSTIGYTNSITLGGFGRQATDKEVSAAIVCDAVSSAFAGVFNSLPNTEFGQNAGMVVMNKIVNRWVFALTAFTLIIAGFFPPLGVIFRSIPHAVLGGSILAVFAMIFTNGMQMIAQDGFTTRNLTILCAVFGIGYGLGGNRAAIEGLQTYEGFVVIERLLGFFHFILSDRIVLVAVTAILLNLLFPRDKEPEPGPGKAEPDESIELEPGEPIKSEVELNESIEIKPEEFIKTEVESRK